MLSAEVQISLHTREDGSGPSLIEDEYLQYSMIRLTDDEGPDQPARMRRLIWAITVWRCNKGSSHFSDLKVAAETYLS